MKKSPVLHAFGLSLTLLASTVLSQSVAMAGELDGFRIHTQDKSVTITLVGDQTLPYSTERHDHQLTITLPETKLSKKLQDEGLPVVIDNQNRFIGRAVPTADGKVKIIIPNLPAEGYAVSIHQQHETASTESSSSIASSAKPASVKHAPPKPLVKQSNPDSVLKPRSAIKTNSKQAFDQVLSRLPSSNVAKQMPLRPGIATTSKLVPPKTILDKLNNPSPMMLSTVEPNSTDPGGKRPGTIWNPYVVKIDPIPKDSNNSQDAANSTQLYPRSDFKPPSQNADFDPYAHLHHLGNESGFNMPSPPSFNFPNILPGNFHVQHPILPAPVKSPLLSNVEENSTIEEATPASKEAASDTKTSSKTIKTKTIVTQSKNRFIASIPEPLRLILRPIFATSHVNWIWFAIGLCLSGVGLFCLLGSAVMGRLLFSRNLGFVPVPQPVPSPFPEPVAPQKAVETPVQNPLNQRRPVRGGLGFQDVAVINALDYTHRSTSSVYEAVRHNPFKERLSARTHAKPRSKSTSSVR